MPFDRCLPYHEILRFRKREDEKTDYYPDRGEPMGLLLALTYTSYRGPQPRER